MPAVADVNREFYDGLWSEARLQSPDRFNTWPLVRKLVDGRSALEIGPGLRPRLPLATTVFLDSSAPAVRSLRDRGARALVGDVARLPFDDGSFGVVGALDIVEHVADDDAVFDEIERVLSPAGSLLLSVPLHQHAWTEFDAFVGHFRRYDPFDLQRKLAERGLTIVESAVYGMQPKSRWLLDLGVWMLRHRRARALRWYNHVLMPIALWRQRPLALVPGLVDLPGVDEVVAVCRRSAASPSVLD